MTETQRRRCDVAGRTNDGMNHQSSDNTAEGLSGDHRLSTANLPTTEKNARAILAIFAHYNLRAGEVLPPNAITVSRTIIGMQSEDFISDIELGWFEKTDR